MFKKNTKVVCINANFTNSPTIWKHERQPKLGEVLTVKKDLGDKGLVLKEIGSQKNEGFRIDRFESLDNIQHKILLLYLRVRESI